MSPILERNKYIYRLMVLISAGMVLLQVLMLIIAWKEEPLLCTLIALLVLVLNAATMFLNHKGMKWEVYWESSDGSRTKRSIFRKGKSIIKKPEDPDGWKYLKAGISDLLTIGVCTSVMVSIVYFTPILNILLWVNMGVEIIGETIIERWYRRKIE